MQNSLKPVGFSLSDQHDARANRQTFWPTPCSYTEDNLFVNPSMQRADSFRQQNKRWMGAFDPEARASRMSFMADSVLLPGVPQPRDQHDRWTPRRQTWLSPGNNATNLGGERVWEGEFEVERRPSWVGRMSRELYEEGMGFDKEVDAIKEKGQPIPVSWEDGDKENPLNFDKVKKWTNAMILALAVFMVSVASSGFSQGM